MNRSVYNEDGKFMGVFVTSPTEFEGGEERFIQSTPYGTLDEIGGRGKTCYYGLRKIFCPSIRGSSIHQALINYLGSPVWINISFEN